MHTTTDIDSAHVYARSVMTRANLLAMEAANQQRKLRDQPPAYGEQAFLEVAQDLGALLKRKGIET